MNRHRMWLGPAREGWDRKSMKCRKEPKEEGKVEQRRFLRVIEMV